MIKDMSKMLNKIKMPRRREKKLVHLDLDTLSKQTAPAARPVTPDDDLFLGGVLRRTRESQHITLAKVSQNLKIKEVYLSALENGQYYAFPGLTYGAGFLRSYARFLNLDERRLVARFYEETSGMKVPHPMVPAAERKNKLPTFQLIFRMMILVFVFYVSWYLIARGLDDELLRRHLPVVDVTASAGGEAVEGDSIEMREDSFLDVQSPLMIEEVLDAVPDQAAAAQ